MLKDQQSAIHEVFYTNEISEVAPKHLCLPKADTMEALREEVVRYLRALDETPFLFEE